MDSSHPTTGFRSDVAILAVCRGPVRAARSVRRAGQLVRIGRRRSGNIGKCRRLVVTRFAPRTSAVPRCRAASRQPEPGQPLVQVFAHVIDVVGTCTHSVPPYTGGRVQRHEAALGGLCSVEGADGPPDQFRAGGPGTCGCVSEQLCLLVIEVDLGATHDITVHCSMSRTGLGVALTAPLRPGTVRSLYSARRRAGAGKRGTQWSSLPRSTVIPVKAGRRRLGPRRVPRRPRAGPRRYRPSPGSRVPPGASTPRRCRGRGRGTPACPRCRPSST